jgi:hypothetical protein
MASNAVPIYKEQQENPKDKDLSSIDFWGIRCCRRLT